VKRRGDAARILRQAAIAATAASVLALAANATRSGRLPLIARTPYETLVPCPEPGGPVEPLAASDPSLASPHTFVIDARSSDAFDSGHLPGALSVPFDWLDPVPDARLGELARAVAASGASRVVVYGDGGRPDSGEYLGRELSGRGIKNVGFVIGGAPALLLGGAG
jgi:hypothetical protein